MKRFMLSLCAFVATASFAFAQPPTTANQVTNEKLDQVVTLEGTVESFRPSKRDNIPNSFMLKDATGVIRVCVWPPVFSQVPNNASLKDGMKVRLDGKVAEFKDKIEVHVDDATKMSLPGAGATPAPAAAAVSPGATSAAAPAQAPAGASAAASAGGVSPVTEITLARKGEVATVRGVVRSIRKPSTEKAPFVMKVGDDTGTVDVVFWTDLATSLPETKKPAQNEKVQVTGTVGEHRGNIQMRLGAPEDIKTERSDPAMFKGALANAPGPAGPPAKAVPATLDKVGSSNFGSRLEVKAEVVSVTPIRLGRRVALRDSTGEATALVWDTADGLKPEIRAVKTSSTVTLQGSVESTDGGRVLVVKRPEDVIAVVP